MLALSVWLAPAVAHAETSVGARARAASERCDGADALPGQAALADVREATLCLMNAQRTARGLPRLRAHESLAAAAGRYARQMVSKGFFDHTSPGGSTMVTRIKGTAYLRGVVSWSVGENLAWGAGARATPRATVDAWMRSSGHRANILNRDFDEVGVGVAAGAPEAFDGDAAAGTYVTDFGRRRRAD